MNKTEMTLKEELMFTADVADDMGEPGDGNLYLRANCEIEKLEAALREANEALRSAYQVISRKGVDTNWKALKAMVSKLLKKQHAILHPKKQEVAQ